MPLDKDLGELLRERFVKRFKYQEENSIFLAMRLGISPRSPPPPPQQQVFQKCNNLFMNGLHPSMKWQ